MTTSLASPSLNAVVIGGGLVGWATAYALAKRAIPALVIDAQDVGTATMAGAGMITPGTNLRPAPGYLPLAIAAMRHYPRLIAELAEANCSETGFANVGAIFVARDESERSLLDFVERTLIERRDAGLGFIGAVERIDGRRARELFPPLAPAVPEAVWFAEGARVNGRLIRAAIRTAALQLGCTELTGQAAIARAGNRLIVTEPSGARHDPDIVVVCSGSWTPLLGAQIGIALPIEPQRGQILHLGWHDDSTAQWPLLESASSHYMLGFPGQRVVAGATRELGAGYDARLTAGGLHEVLTEALAIAPGIGRCQILETRVGLRPISPDGIPAIGRLADLENGWICAGHGPSGLTLGPYSGELVAQLIAGEQPDVTDPVPYSPNRWSQ